MFFPIAEIHSNVLNIFDVFGIWYTDNNVAVTVINTYPVAILNGLVLLSTFVAIFLYKKRKLQIRMSTFALIFELGIYGMIAYYGYYVAPTKFDVALSYKLVLAVPLINTIMLYLSIRGILKDEALIRSLDRIR
jgi:hypothetical protein